MQHTAVKLCSMWLIRRTEHTPLSPEWFPSFQINPKPESTHYTN